MYDLNIDDREFREFPNFYQFCMAPEGLNTPFWSRQFWICLSVLNEICPVCTIYKTVFDVPKTMSAEDFGSHVTILYHGKCKKCGNTKLSLYKKGLFYPYNELCGLAGQRIGKSLQVAALAVYLSHKFVKLQDPSKMYSVLRTTFVGTFVALTFDAALQQLWLPFKGFIDNSEWFKSLIEHLKDVGKRQGIELVKYGQTSLYFLHRGLLVHPAGPDRRILRGKTRLFSAIDELDFFNSEAYSDSVKMNGVEVLKSLNNSLLTVRTGWKEAMKKGIVNLANGYQLNISSPQHANGVLTERTLQNQHSKKIFTLHAATWEIHPILTEKAIREEFSGDDPFRIDRDFGAIPPRADRPFLTIDNAMRMLSKKSNLVRLQYIHRTSPSGQIRRSANIVHASIPANLPPSVLSIDAGVTNNSFALTIGHVETTATDIRLNFPIVLEILPERGKVSVDFAKTTLNVIYELIKKYNVQAVLADRWNSIKLLHDIELEFNIPAEQYSIKYRDFIMLRSYIEAGLVLLPKTETEIPTGLLTYDILQYPKIFEGRPSDHLFLQCCTVSDNDKSIVKGSNSKLSDDIWRAMALGAVKMLDAEWRISHLKDTKKGNVNRIVAVMPNGLAVHGGTGHLSYIQPNMNTNITSVVYLAKMH